MPEVLLSNDDLTVFGPPSVVEVLVDIGPKGQRGSQFYVGIGNPNAQTVSGVLGGQTLYLNDLYINTSPGGENGYIYQYVAQPSGNVWVEVLNIFPAFYSVNYDVTFDAGDAEVVIPIADIAVITGTQPTAENFSVQYSIAHDVPVSSSMQIPPLAGAEEDLVINFKAAEYSGSTWSALDETVTIHLNITFVESEPVS